MQLSDSLAGGVRVELRGLGKGYKYVALRDADVVARGSVKLGALDHYRAQEGERGDLLEGRVETRVRDFWQPAEVTPLEVERLRHVGIDVEGSTGVRVVNATVITDLSPLYIYCCSAEPDFDYARRNDLAIFEIPHLGRIGAEITSAASSALESLLIGSVHYSPRSIDPFTANPVRPNPFVKDNKFAWEREIRLVWQPRSSKPDDVLITQISSPELHLTRLA